MTAGTQHSREGAVVCTLSQAGMAWGWRNAARKNAVYLTKRMHGSEKVAPFVLLKTAENLARSVGRAAGEGVSRLRSGPGGGGGGKGRRPGQQARGGKPGGWNGRGGASAALSVVAIEDLSLASVEERQLEQQRRSKGRQGKRLAAGACSAMVARTLLAPLERVKLECVINNADGAVAAAKRLLEAEGVVGLWRGNLLNVLRTAPYKALNFAVFDMLHDLGVAKARREGRTRISNTDRFVAGAGAGFVSTLCCFPMDTIRTRLMRTGGWDLYGGVGGAIRTMVRQEGVGAFYRGLVPALISMAPSGAVFYGVYDMLKNHHRDHVATNGEPMGAVRTMAHGAIAGAAAETAVYPLEVVRRRLQMDTARTGVPVLRRMTQEVRSIVQAQGVGGMYRGVLPSTMQVLPSAAIGYYTYEVVKRRLQAGSEQEDYDAGVGVDLPELD